jgi:hypothetical protein
MIKAVYRDINTTIWVYSMGKRFQLMAVATTDAAANDFCKKHADAAVIAELDGLVFIANRFEGIVS